MTIRKFFNLMLQNKEILIYTNGTQKRDFTYLSDIIDGLININGKPHMDCSLIRNPLLFIPILMEISLYFISLIMNIANT